MSSSKLKDTKAFYDNAYGQDKLDAQRRWPNEEFCRFMGRNFFSIDKDKRKSVKILEVGSGTGANLRLLADEGFSGYGIELSSQVVELMPLLLKNGGVKDLEVVIGNMMNLPWKDKTFNAVVDVFSANCLDERDFEVFVGEVYRVLDKGGKYFSYTPSKGSDAFINYEPAKKIDKSTLDGIHRDTAPYYGNFYPYRFMDEKDVEGFFDKKRFRLTYFEKVQRTYFSQRERFEFLVFEAEKV